MEFNKKTSTFLNRPHKYSTNQVNTNTLTKNNKINNQQYHKFNEEEKLQEQM